MARNFQQGVFVPKNPHKYVGDLDKIVYRSSYELQTFGFLDGNPNVLRWASEEIQIQYHDRVTNKIRTYFPDLWVEYANKDGEIIREIVEIKPKSQTRAPNRRHKHYMAEAAVFETNKCKWEAASRWAEERGMKFRLLTEAGIFK